MTKPIRVLLVDDHVLFRQGLASLLSAQPDMEVVGEAADGLEALVKAQKLRPDLILMDVTMPGCDGLEATRLIREAVPETRIVMLTVHDEDEKLFEAIRSGAVGYVLKSIAAQTLIPLLRNVLMGEAAISGVMARRILEEFRRLARHPAAAPGEGTPELTDREREVLQRVAAGDMDKEIALRLNLSLSTVKTHLRNILAKLQATSRHQASRYALRMGLIQPPDRREK